MREPRCGRSPRWVTSREAPRGHRARHGRQGDSAHRLCQSGTEQIHTCALECGNVTLSADPVPCRARRSTQLRERLPRRRAEASRLPDIRGGAAQGRCVRTPRCSCRARTSDPDVGDRERRPGGHRARQGRLNDTADRLSGSGTDHVHTVALEVSNVTLAVAITRLRRVAEPARRAAYPSGAGVWTILYWSGGADESDALSAAKAGSMPAWRPLRE